MGKRVNQRELAEILELSDVRIWELQREGLPIAERGERGEAHVYDTAAVISWLTERALARHGSSEAQLKREKLELEVSELRRKDALARGELVPAAEVLPVWESRVLAASAFMLGRASRLSALLETARDQVERRAILKESDREFLTHLGVHGSKIQDVMDELLAELPEVRRERFFAAMEQTAMDRGVA